MDALLVLLALGISATLILIVAITIDDIFKAAPRYKSTLRKRKSKRARFNR